MTADAPLFHEHLDDSLTKEPGSYIEFTVIAGAGTCLGAKNVYVTLQGKGTYGVHFRLTPDGARKLADLLVAAAAASEAE